MKTKIIISAVLFASLTSVAFAQFETNIPQFENGKGYKWGCAVAINDAHSQIAFVGEQVLGIDADGNMIDVGKKTNNSFAWSITPKYYVNNEWVIRFEYGMTKIDLKNNYSYQVSGYYTSPTNQTSIDAVEQKINRFVPGIQWNFFTNKRIQTYGGVNLPYVKYSSTTRNLYYEQRNVAMDTLTATELDIKNIPGGFSIGLGVFAGFNVFLHKHVSLGAEFSTAYTYYKVGGESTLVTTIQNIPAPMATGAYTLNESYTGTRFNKIISSFNVSVWF